MTHQDPAKPIVGTIIARLPQMCGLAVLASLAACFPSATNLNPARLPVGHGAVFGHVRVFKGDSEVTGACYLDFTDQNGDDRGSLSLDDSGWVFSSFPMGQTYLSTVRCAVWNGLFFHTRKLDFDVTGNGRTTYFGHVRFDLPDEDMKALGEAIVSGAAGVPAASIAGAAVTSGTVLAGAAVVAASPDGRSRVSVGDESRRAMAEYRARYGGKPKIFLSLLGTPPGKVAEPIPEVVRRGELVFTRARLNRVTLTWFGVVNGDQRRLGIRLQRNVREPKLQDCKQLELVVDGRSQTIPLSYTAKRASPALQETIEVETDAATIKAVVRAKAVDFKVCSLTRRLSPRGAQAASKLVAAYESLMAEQAEAAEPATIDAGSALPQKRASASAAKLAAPADPSAEAPPAPAPKLTGAPASGAGQTAASDGTPQASD